MKKFKPISFLLFCICLLMVSCKPEIKQCSGRIKTLTDSTIVLRNEGKEYVFNIKRAKYINGAIMKSDSVLIHYIGNIKGNAQALLIKLVPVSHFIDIKKDTSQILITTPAKKEEAKKLREFVETSKKHKKV